MIHAIARIGRDTSAAISPRQGDLHLHERLIKFEAGGEKWKLMTLGGNLLENVLSTEEQSNGLDAFLQFLAAADPRSRG